MRQAEFEELDLPPPLQFFRVCGTRGCRRHARPSGRHCAACHAAAVRRWRDRSRVALNERRRLHAAGRDEEERARDSGRAALAMALKRGTLTRGWCVVCADRNTIAHQGDPHRPLAVTWVCRRDRPVFMERLAAERDREVQQSAWNERRLRCERELPLLPPSVQAAIAAEAAIRPVGLTLAAETPLYAMNCVRIFERVAKAYHAGGVNASLDRIEGRSEGSV